MTDNTAKIAAKGCSATGITEELARHLHANLGQKVVAVVELVAAGRTENLDGKETVTLNILTVEPAPNTDTEDHLRELARAFYYERQAADGAAQLRLDDDIEPKVSDVLRDGGRYRPHPYLASTLSIDEGAVCDICGSIEASAVHGPQDLEVLDDDDDQGDQDEVTEEDEPHAFVSDDDVDSCRLCGRHEADGEDIHVTTDDDNQALHAVPDPFTT